MYLDYQKIIFYKIGFMAQHEFYQETKALEEPEIKLLLKNLSTRRKFVQIKYRAIIKLMHKCGLRVSEVCRLQLKHFNFQKGKHGIVIVESLKKGNSDLAEAKTKRLKDKFRTIHMTYDTMTAVIDQIEQLKARNSEAYLFPAGKASEREEGISRAAIWEMLKSLSHGTIFPHRLRHSFGTDLVDNGADLQTVKDLMGHRHLSTTSIYIHSKEKRKQNAVMTLDQPNWWEKLNRRFRKVQRVDIIPMEVGTQFHVGREKERAQLMDLIEKKVNILISGEAGIGKTHILDNIQLDKAWRVDTMDRKALAGMLLELHAGDKAAVLEKVLDNSMIHKVITKESIKRLAQILKKVTNQYEYTIILDNAELITKRNVTIMEDLKNHFHFIIAGREIKIQYKEFVSNFEKVELKALSRMEVTKLVNLSSKSFISKIEDYEAYKTHIWNKTLGNPGKALELIERFKKEGNITAQKIPSIEFVSAMKEIDMSVPLLVGLSSLMVLRYVGGELDDDSGAFRLFGGAFMLIALFARSLFNNVKRKHV